MTRSLQDHPSPTGKCVGCGKNCYRSRKAARAAARHNHPGAPLRAYKCPDSVVDVWHYGHHDEWRRDPKEPAVRPAPPSVRAAMAAIAKGVKRPPTG